MSAWEGNAKIILILLCAFSTPSRCQPIPAQHYTSSALCVWGPCTAQAPLESVKAVLCEENRFGKKPGKKMGSSRKPFPLAQGIGYRKMDKGLQVGGFLCRSWRTKCWGILASRSLLGKVEEGPFCLGLSWLKNPKPKTSQPSQNKRNSYFYLEKFKLKTKQKLYIKKTKTETKEMQGRLSLFHCHYILFSSFAGKEKGCLEKRGEMCEEYGTSTVKASP